MVFSLLRAEPPASLSNEESAELSARLAALTQSGLPLEGGLRALADELRQPRLGRVLRSMAARLEAGESLESAIAAQGLRLPAHLRGLIVAGVRSGRLPKALEQFAALARRQHDLRRRLTLSLTYPAILLGIMALLAVLCRLLIVEEFEHIFRDFGTKLPDVTMLYFATAGPIACVLTALALAALLLPLASLSFPPGSWLGGLLTWIPIVGPIVAYDRYARFSQLMAILLEEEVPLAESLRLTAVAMEGTPLARQCRAAAGSIEAGESIDPALDIAGFPATLTAMSDWGQEKNCLAETFHAAAEAFEVRSQSQGSLLNMIILPVAYLTVLTFVGFMVVALLMPLVSLIANLSGGC